MCRTLRLLRHLSNTRGKVRSFAWCSPMKVRGSSHGVRQPKVLDRQVPAMREPRHFHSVVDRQLAKSTLFLMQTPYRAGENARDPSRLMRRAIDTAGFSVRFTWYDAVVAP